MPAKYLEPSISKLSMNDRVTFEHWLKFNSNEVASSRPSSEHDFEVSTSIARRRHSCDSGRQRSSSSSDIAFVRLVDGMLFCVTPLPLVLATAKSAGTTPAALGVPTVPVDSLALSLAISVPSSAVGSVAGAVAVAVVAVVAAVAVAAVIAAVAVAAVAAVGADDRVAAICTASGSPMEMNDSNRNNLSVNSVLFNMMLNESIEISWPNGDSENELISYVLKSSDRMVGVESTMAPTVLVAAFCLRAFISNRSRISQKSVDFVGYTG